MSNVETEQDSSVTAYVQTAVPVVCPDCAVPGSRIKEHVVGTFRDVSYGGRRVRVVWCKRRWSCLNEACPRGSFTESAGDFPARARVTTRLCPAFRAAVRQALPHALLCVDAFHLVQLTNKMVTSVRWRIVRSKYGRRGRKTDPEYGIKRLLTRNREDLSPTQFAKLWNTMADDSALTDLHLAWIAKEHLRDLLALRITRSHTTPAPSLVRDRWTSLLTWCADHAHVNEIAAFARTLDTWRDEIINAVLTGVSNASSEGINRTQKLDARAAFGYRNPENQRHRARTATRRPHKPSRNTISRSRLWVTGPQHHPG